jgi:hypothetical protein
MKIMRLLVPVCSIAALSACGGGGGSNPFGGNPQNNYCQPGTLVQVVSPTPQQYNANVNQVVIDASGDNDNIHPAPQNWSIYVLNTYSGATINGGPLNPYSDPGGPHPFASDFYYQSNLQQTLPPGGSWQVMLQENNTGCSALPLQSFST